MDSTVSYKAFEINKSYRDIINDSIIWISDFNFINKELLFLKAIVKSNSFKSSIPNLFERLQLLIKDIDLLVENNNVIKEKVEKYKLKVTNILNNNVFSFGEDLLENYEDIEKEIFEFNKKYKNFKAYLYEFLIEII
ncbi:hypothetical protein [uncultured Lutibacter sp.]|uniref:hypothetical protein n=1 Tax=uncultured Lutibacter sp. TaxID=437739 RepID=UPI0026363FD8|nr:hypothetical protein [uncultured Lutibacter sp.]